MPAPNRQEIFVSAARGSNGNSGASTSEFQTIGAAWTNMGAGQNALGRDVDLIIRGGTYREYPQINPTTAAQVRLWLDGDVTISGADVVTSWTLDTGRIFWTTWTNNWGLAAWPDASWSAAATAGGWTDVLRRREMVIVDGVWLRQVLTYAELATYDGAYYVDETGVAGPADRLYVKFPSHAILPNASPATSRSVVEVAMRNRCLTLDGVTGLEIVGPLTVQHAATELQESAFKLDNCDDALVWGLTARQHSYAGVSDALCERNTYRECHFDDNGVKGFSAYRPKGLLLDDLTNSRNNQSRGRWSGFLDWDESFKVFEARGVTARQVVWSDNNGPGFWADTDCRDLRLSDCGSYRNRYGYTGELVQGPMLMEGCKSAYNFRNLRWTHSARKVVRRCTFWCDEVSVGHNVFTTPSITEWDTGATVSTAPGGDEFTDNVMVTDSSGAVQLFHETFGMSQAQFDAWKAASYLDRNKYYAAAGTSTTPFQRISGGAAGSVNFATWQSATAQEANSTYTQTLPPKLPWVPG